MRFLSAAHTDVGISKKINQDAFGLKIAKTSESNIAFAIICDGMGGLENGELASAFVVNAFSNWFENEFPVMLNGHAKPDFTQIRQRWNGIAVDQGKKIMEYGNNSHNSMGTTLTAILIVNHEYIYIQIGDSRIYKLGDSIVQLTKDQTLVAREVEMGRMTPEEAAADNRKNVLLQCIGASKTIVPDIQTGVLKEDDVFLLCSDGFRHEISEQEIFGVMAPPLLTDEKVMKKSLVDLINLNKKRNEKDNITALLVKAVH
ncbi:MAG: serine/threonine-protein phosphatase [Lachnospiraceae bacterium]|nr:serine/threonine-protein phosphatase [Lachnospiraceae bacterium]